jgi:predicted TIM-barrel fold metal-dependent hydrolase
MVSRRRFMGSTLGAGLALATQGYQQTAAQPARKRIIVDAQVHLWKAETPDWRWVPGLVPQLPEPFTIEKLVPLMNEAGVDRAVIVPPSWPGDRNDYGLEAAKRYPGRFAVMGRIPLKNPQSTALLPKWKEQPGMLGVRVTFLGGDAVWLTDGTADWFWPAAEKAGLPVMFLTTGMLPLFAPIAERHSGLPLIVDHMGLSAEVWKDKRAQIPTVIDQAVALAKYPNVSIKMSAAPNASLEPYPFRDMTVHLRRVFDAYGPQRCYWGTDMTNSLAKASYRQRITHFTEELNFLSEDDKDWVMGRAIRTRLNWA